MFDCGALSPVVDSSVQGPDSLSNCGDAFRIYSLKLPLTFLIDVGDLTGLNGFPETDEPVSFLVPIFHA